MRHRSLVKILGVAGLLLAVAFGPLLHAADVRGNGKEQGKIGDLCRTNNDCEQRPRPLTCREQNGESRCYAVPIRPPT